MVLHAQWDFYEVRLEPIAKLIHFNRLYVSFIQLTFKGTYARFKLFTFLLRKQGSWRITFIDVDKMNHFSWILELTSM